jgi:hypothetical protein
VRDVVEGIYKVQGLVVLCHSFYIYFFKHPFIQYNYAFIHTSPFAEGRHLVFSSLLGSAREASMGCRDENRTWACRTACKPTH